jgi:peroxiredoxin
MNMLKTFRKTKHYRERSSAWQKKYDAQAPRAGDEAPDFELGDVDGQHSVRLSDFQGKKPVALVFGSFT